MGRFYQAHACKDCGEPHWWDDDVRSEKTGNRVPLNSDHTKHFTTCSARNPESQREAQPVPKLSTAGPAHGDWETRLGLINGQIFQRLDRMDEGLKQIARAIDGINAYIRMQAEGAESERNDPDG